jgi:hypothetical protein
MSQQSKQQKYTQADLQIRNLLLEREELRQRFNVQTQLLTYLAKTYGDENHVIILSRAEIEKLDMATEGVSIRTANQIAILGYQKREAPKTADGEVECVCGGNATLEGTHTEDCEWWKRHKVAPRVEGMPADHKLCPIHKILWPIGQPCGKCLDEATAQVKCECGAPKYRHLAGFGKCKDEDCECEQWRPKMEAQA